MDELTPDVNFQKEADDKDDDDVRKSPPSMLVFSPCSTPLPIVDDDASTFSSLSLDDSNEINGPEDQDDSFLMDIAEEAGGRPSYHFYGIDDDDTSLSLGESFLFTGMAKETSNGNDVPESAEIANLKSSKTQNDLKQEPVLKRTSPSRKHNKCPRNTTQTKKPLHGDNGKPTLARKPKRPLSAYNIFFRLKRAELVRDDSKLSFASIGKVIGKAWKSISAKELRKYERISAKDMVRYRKQITLWRKIRRMRLRGEEYQIPDSEACEDLKEPSNDTPTPIHLLQQMGHQEEHQDAKPQQDYSEMIPLIHAVGSEQPQPARPTAESPAPPAVVNLTGYYDYTPPATPLHSRLHTPVPSPHTTAAQRPQAYRLVSPCHSTRTTTLIPTHAGASSLAYNGAPRNPYEGIVRNWDPNRIQVPPRTPPYVSVPGHYYVEPYPANNKKTRVPAHTASVVSASRPYYYSQPLIPIYPSNRRPETSTIQLPLPYLDEEERSKYTVSYTCIRMRQSQVQGYIERFYGGGGCETVPQSHSTTTETCNVEGITTTPLLPANSDGL